MVPREQWSGTSILNIPIGQGVAVTLAQIAAGVADNANMLAAQVAQFTTAKGAERDIALGTLSSETQLGLARTAAETTQHADTLHAATEVATITATKLVGTASSTIMTRFRVPTKSTRAMPTEI